MAFLEMIKVVYVWTSGENDWNSIEDECYSKWSVGINGGCDGGVNESE